MMTGDPSAPTPLTVQVSTHAVEQYQYRVRPGLDPGAARAEFGRLRAAGEISPVAPGWLHAAKDAPYYLLLGEDVVLAGPPPGKRLDRDDVRHPAHAHANPPGREIGAQEVASSQPAPPAPNPFVGKCRSPPLTTRSE